MPAEIPDEQREVQRGAENHAGQLEQRDERHRCAEHDQQAAQALAARQPCTAGPGAARLLTRKSDSAAITMPRQNGRKAEPGPPGPHHA